ncbi:DNA-binding response regulator [Burkholderia sp. Bp8963]|uniref:response regulator transcription factor n=1 Tax=Burkholderia sp. Bp8963 TaxID=2184547 RepID=UPI000F592429|nr:response regulator [Burkholderia sp. Bp8963]RQS57031.1 DNA-binding response regulator [Burkholderia sp. Bp8963]
MTPVHAVEREAELSSSQATPVVFVVDDDVSVREAIEAMTRFAGLKAETYACAQDFLGRPRVMVPNCLVLDVSLPDLSGLDLQNLIATERTDMPIIFITGNSDVPTTVRAMKAGAVEFLVKPFDDQVLLDAIRHAIERSRAALREEAGMQSIRDRYASLSRREREVMALVVTGLLNKRVGAELGISEITVKVHRRQVMRKMSARSLAELIGMAWKLDSDYAPKAALRNAA